MCLDFCPGICRGLGLRVRCLGFGWFKGIGPYRGSRRSGGPYPKLLGNNDISCRV